MMVIDNELIREFQLFQKRKKHAVKLTEELSAREMEVAILVSKGMTSLAISKKLLISSRTVEIHRRNILRKFKVDNSVHVALIMNDAMLAA